MFIVIKGVQGGELIWSSTHDTEAEATDLANEEMLREEEVIFVVPCAAFRQQLD